MTTEDRIRNSQFKPGKSGNPRGRPKGTRNFATQYLEEMGTLVPGRDGEPAITKLEAVIRTQIELAIGRELRAAQQVLDRMVQMEAKLDRNFAQGPAWTDADREAIADIHRRLAERADAG